MSEETVVPEVRPFVLPPGDRLDLVNLTNQPGWRVLNRMMEAACQTANAKVIQCDPTDRDRVLTLQMEARATNAFCTLLGKAVQWHVACQKNGHASQRTIEELMDVTA